MGSYRSDSGRPHLIAVAPPSVFPAGPLWCLPAVVDSNVSGRGLHKVADRRRRRARRRSRRGYRGPGRGGRWPVLEAESDVGVDRRGYADVRVAQQLLDDQRVRGPVPGGGSPFAAVLVGLGAVGGGRHGDLCPT